MSTRAGHVFDRLAHRRHGWPPLGGLDDEHSALAATQAKEGGRAEH
jgi:hypothetical protein